MALSILDGNQSATTLSTILSSGQHITAHTVVSLGTQAITDMRGAVSGSVVSISNFPASQSVTFGATTGSVSILNFPASQAVTFSAVSISNFPSTQPVSIASVTVGNTVTIVGTVTASISNSVTIASIPAISGTVTANVFGKDYDGTAVALPILTHESNVATRGIPIGFNDNGGGSFLIVNENSPLPVAPAFYDGSPTYIQLGQEGDASSPSVVVPIGFAGDGEFKRVAFNSGLPIAGTVTIGSALPAGTNRIGVVTIGAGTVTIGAGTAQIGSVTASISNSVTIGSLPAISGTVTANLSISSTAITSGSFTSLTSATLVPANTSRKMATVYNLGAGQLFINAGVTATTLGGGFMVALSSGDFYECPYTTTTLSAIFATAGTASWISH